MTLRTLGDADAPAYWALRLEALTREPFAFGQPAESHRATNHTDTAAALRALGPRGFALGCFVNDALVGILRFAREPMGKQGHKGSIHSFYVTPSQRGCGLGRALLVQSIQRASQDPTLEQILLHVSATQTRAVALYRSLGFTIYGTEPRALKIEADYADQHLMILCLPSPLTAQSPPS